MTLANQRKKREAGCEGRFLPLLDDGVGVGTARVGPRRRYIRLEDSSPKDN